jgi:hypothetical protein
MAIQGPKRLFDRSPPRRIVAWARVDWSKRMAANRRLEAALTARFLTPATPILEDLFLSLRAETDQALGQGAPARYGKPYPYGYCREITRDVALRLNARITQPRHPGERAIKAYLDRGGSAGRIWGALRDRFFQNALQMGSLYIDVSNDTVDVTKPKVEILPMDLSGFETIRDAEHYVRIGKRYWGASFYANHAVPSLAPLFPIIGVDKHGYARLHCEGQEIIDLFRGDDFALSKRWLENGPPPPAAVIEAIRANCPADLLEANPVTGLDAALLACRQARDTGSAANVDWRAARSAELMRTLETGYPRSRAGIGQFRS